MARSRNIKPSFFTNDVLADCCPLARLLFIGLWTIADKEGRLEDRVKKIKAEVLPYDDCNCDDLLNSLYHKGFIIRYSVSGNNYIQIVNFTKHQHPHIKETASLIPAPDLHSASTDIAPDLHGASSPSYLLPLTLTPIPHTSTSVDDNARGKEIFSWLEKFFNSPNPYHYAPVIAWLGWGADFELDIKPVAERYMKRKQSPPRSLQWLDEEITKSINQRNKKKPEVNQNATYQPSNQPTKTDRLKAAAMRAAIAGGFAPITTSQGAINDNPLSVFPIS